MESRSLCTSVVIVGSGISGLFTALKIAEQGLDVLLVTKSLVSENNSRYAQGGIAAVLPENTEDSIALHVQDTLAAGAGLCNELAVRSILSEGHLAIADLLLYGVPFDRDERGLLALTKEAAHSVRRIIHAGGDATGRSVEMALIKKVENDPRIHVIEHCSVLDLIMEDHQCIGCYAVQLPDNPKAKSNAPPIFYTITAQHTVLATGGIGQLYKHTTNPTIATGDGMALAHRAGVPLLHMEFVQFHPTAFYAQGKVQFLISEALRGEGATLKNLQGEAFAQKYHPDGELAPRDVVTRAIFSEMQAQKLSQPDSNQPSQNPHVLLDISHLPASKIEERFPNILDACLQFGIDIRHDPIPVAPAAHYMMGGFAVDLEGSSNIEGLYGIGETVHTGLHGANRLASNSLLECVVLARRVATHIAAHIERAPFCPIRPLQTEVSHWRLYHTETIPQLNDAIDRLHTLMWDYVGIVRNPDGLQWAHDQVVHLEDEGHAKGWFYQLPDGKAFQNQLEVAKAIIESAQARKASVGAHYLFPSKTPATV